LRFGLQLRLTAYRKNKAMREAVASDKQRDHTN
jgi:hypothetical protein